MAAHSLTTEQVMEFEEIAVCSDCIMLIANGDLPPDTDEETDALLIDGTVGVMYDGEELGFSWRPCECCKRKLGGDRFKAYREVVLC